MSDSDQVVVITGAGRGIGRACALGLAATGRRIVVNDRGGDWRGDGADAGPATLVVEEIVAAGGHAVADGGDVTDEHDAERLVARALETYGRVDGVINGAGFVRDRMVFSLDADDFDAVIRVHLRGHFLVTRAACRHWRGVAKSLGRTVDGSVICVASEAGLYGNAGQSNYSAAKGAITSFALVVAREMERYGVRCNVIAPRARTRMTEQTFGDFDAAGGPHPWDPENVVPTAEFLISPEGRSYTGQILVAGGGVLQVISHHEVEAELDTGASPPPVDEVGAFLRDALGNQAGPPPFPDLGLPTTA
jgi:NAD(P)-dependent dehydrogenase (short-subunit alcohol dehydrogenase family)